MAGIYPAASNVMTGETLGEEQQDVAPNPPQATQEEQRSGAPILRAHPDALALVGDTKLSELKAISRRLGRMSKWKWDRFFVGAMLLFLGGAIGAGVGLVPFLSSTPPPSHVARREYIALVIIAGVIGIVCGVACLAAKSERDDATEAIKEDLDELLAAYERQDEAAGIKR